MKSVSFVFCREVSVVQFDNSTPVESHFSSSAHCYKYFETMTVGWEQGSRTRIKRFRDLHQACAYANKLYVHGYLSEESYCDVLRRFGFLADSIDFDVADKVSEQEGSSLNEVV